MHRLAKRFELIALASTIAFLGSCGAEDDGTGPQGIQRTDVVGSYQATTFLTTTDGAQTDQLAAGAVFDLALTSDGATTGRLFVPGGNEDGSDFDRGLGGTWTFADATDEIQFDHPADTFVRDVTFQATRVGGSIQLRGEDSFGTMTIRVVLE